MIICVTPEDLARDRQWQHDGKMIEMFGDRSRPWDGPCGHLVRQPPGHVVHPHFHEADQYQVFVAGSGRIGGHEVRAGTVHYSDAFSGYGPIIPDAEGCSYMTLRPTFDTTHHSLPKEASRARGRSGRQATVDLDLDEAGRHGIRTLFSRPDGAATHQLDLKPHEAAPDLAMAGGAYWLVMAGAIAVDGRPCPAETCLWVGEGETRPDITAGAEGATLAVLGFPDARSRAARVGG